MFLTKESFGFAHTKRRTYILGERRDIRFEDSDQTDYEELRRFETLVIAGFEVFGNWMIGRRNPVPDFQTGFICQSHFTQYLREGKGKYSLRNSEVAFENVTKQ
jgi:hypothetical protein